MKKSKEMCCDCYNNFYNHNREGGCWSFKTAKVVKRVCVGTWQPSPYKCIPIEILSCYHRQGYSFLELSDCRIVGNKS